MLKNRLRDKNQRAASNTFVQWVVASTVCFYMTKIFYLFCKLFCEIMFVVVKKRIMTGKIMYCMESLNQKTYEI